VRIRLTIPDLTITARLRNFLRAGRERTSETVAIPELGRAGAEIQGTPRGQAPRKRAELGNLEPSRSEGPIWKARDDPVELNEPVRNRAGADRGDRPVSRESCTKRIATKVAERTVQIGR